MIKKVFNIFVLVGLYISCFLDKMQLRDRVNALLQFLKLHIPTEKALKIQVSEMDTSTEWIDKIITFDPNELHKKVVNLCDYLLLFQGIREPQIWKC